MRNLAEEGRVAIRNVRRDMMQDLRELKDDGEASSDDEHRAEVELQKLTDGADRRARRRAQGQGRGDPRGLMELAGQRASAADGAGSPGGPAAATSRSSPTATAAGRSAAACRSTRATARAPTPSRRACATPSSLGVEELTVYSFSTENWSRPAEEVAGLMAMFSERIAGETPELHEEGVRMRFIGRREGVGERWSSQMDWAEELTGGQQPDHAVRGLQLRRARRDPRRRARASRAAARRSSARACTRPRCTTPT